MVFFRAATASSIFFFSSASILSPNSPSDFSVW
jgi:hypothetical protein